MKKMTANNAARDMTMIRNLFRRNISTPSITPSAMPPGDCKASDYSFGDSPLAYELEPAYCWLPENSVRISMPGGHRLRDLNLGEASALLQRRTENEYFAHTDSAAWTYTNLIEAKTRIVHAAARRCIPWAACLTVPALWRHGSSRLRGVAIYHHGVAAPIIAVGVCSMGAAEVGRIAHHEIWHVAEKFMSSNVLRDFNRMQESAVAYGNAGYLDTPVERRARAYAGYADSRDLGLVYDGDRDDCSLHDVFERVYSGRFGEEIVNLGWKSVTGWMEKGRAEDELTDFLCG